MAEIDNRIATAWRKFGVFKGELTSKKFSLKSRLRLFESTVSATVLYGCCAWPMTASLEQKLRTCQRRMLRMVVGQGRRIDVPGTGEMEPWVEWIKRTTAIADNVLCNLQMDSWVTACRRAKWRWAAKLASMQDTRWARLAAEWAPELHLQSRRCAGRPKTRWEDALNSFFVK